MFYSSRYALIALLYFYFKMYFYSSINSILDANHGVG